MKNILVTGGCGFIGSHTVVELIGAGYEPIIIDNFSNSERSVLDGIKKITGRSVAFYEGSVEDKKLLTKIFNEHQIEGIIHFAAYKAVDESVKKPLMYYENNVSGLVTLLQAAEEHHVTSFVFSSSCTVYGEPDHLPITEVSPVKPAVSPYGATKQTGEIITRDTAHASQNLRAIALRYFNPIGAHPSAAIGELPHGVPANLVPFVTQAAAGWRKGLTVYGNDYDTPDGSNVRDYIHVVDLALAHIKALEHIARRSPGFYDFCNCGTGRGSSVLEVIKTFEDVTGQKLTYHIGPRRPGDIVQIYASVDKAKAMLGWETTRSLAEGLEDAWRWQQTLTKPS